MRWGEVLTLVEVNLDQDALRQDHKNRNERTVRANPWRLSFAEKMSAGMDTMRGALRFEVQTIMYRGETEAIYQGNRYSVNADRRGTRTILTLTEVAGNANHIT